MVGVAFVSFALVAALCSSGSFASDQFLYKKMAGPPSEFADFFQPSSYDAAQGSRALMLPTVELSPLHLHDDVKFPVASCSLVVVSMFFDVKQQKHLELSFTDPTGKEATPDRVVDDYLGFNTGDFYPCMSYMFVKPQVGQWSMRVSWKLFDGNKVNSLSTSVYFTIAFQESDLQVWTALRSTDLRLGKDIIMEAMIPVPGGLVDGTGRPQPNVQMVQDAEVTIVEPDGDTFTKDMKDETNDGIYEAVFRPLTTGIYNALVTVEGKDQQGNEFARSLWYLFRVAEPSLNLTGSASASLYTHPVTNAVIINLDVGVKWDPSANPVYRGYAEVWGVSADDSNTEVPVAWVSGMVQVIKDSSANRSSANESSPYKVRFELDSRWLDVAKAKAPLQLRNLTFEESDGFVALVYPTTLPVTTADRRLREFQPGRAVSEITYEMRNGFNYYRWYYSEDPTPGKIVLVHGYCSSDVPYSAEDFTDAVAFKDFKQSRSNDEFAQRIIEFAESEHITKFSTASHSHGGIATLHMYTYYQTGMDATTSGGRKLQSVGTPYHGSPLAGLIATLGSILGIGCGSNDDLTYCASERWLSKLPPEAQKEVFYYTTEYKDNNILDHFCFPGASVVLSQPNDGVAEVDKTSLSYGHPVDHFIGECHTVMMRWPPQCKDHSRNKVINGTAAR